MTVLVGLATAEGTWIGSDSHATQGSRIAPATVPKWLVRDTWALGLTGDYRATQVLGLASLEEPRPAPYELGSWAIRHLQAAGFVPDTKEVTPSWGVSGLLVTEHGFFDFGSDFGMLQLPQYELWARGSGMEYALGAFYALSKHCADPARSPRELLAACLAAACRYETGCGDELFIKFIPQYQET